MCTPAPLQKCPAQALERKAVIGKGLTSDVLAWDEKRVLKLFHSDFSHAQVERECRVTRALHAAGLPVPAVHELVDIDGRLGIVFEKVEGVSIFRKVQARPWTLFAAVRQLAELHARIHACKAPADLPSQRDWIASRIDAAQDLSAADKQRARRCLNELPDGETLCHGDFHPDNVIVTRGGPVIIDWGTATRGHPLGDVACTSWLFQSAGLPPWAPLHSHLLLKVFRASLHRTYLNRYLQLRPGTRQEIAAWQAPISAAASGWRIGAANGSNDTLLQ